MARLRKNSLLFNIFSCVAFAVPNIFANSAAGSTVNSATNLDHEELFELSIDELKSIVVTARKKAEKLELTPLAVSVFDTATIETHHINQLSDIGSSSPNISLAVSQEGSSAAHAYIRGIGEWDFLLTTDPAVGTYIDGIYLARTWGTNLELLDIEQIEILRGPQGTLYGKNTIAGAINITTKKPSKEKFIATTLSLGEDNAREIDAITNTPINDSLDFRLATLYKQGDGWQDRLNDDAPTDDTFIGRASLNWLPTDNLAMLLSLEGAHQDQQGYPNNMIKFADGSFFGDAQNTYLSPCCAQYVSTDPNKTQVSSDITEDNIDLNALTLSTTWTPHTYQLRSITGYRHINATTGRDGDGSALHYASDFHDQKQRQISQEFQLSSTLLNDRLNWLFGLYYMNEESEDHIDLVTAEGLYDAAIDAGVPPEVAVFYDLNVRFDHDQSNHSKAVFFDLNYKLTEKWTLGIGSRLSDERKDFDSANIRTESLVPLLSNSSFEQRDQWRENSPKAELSYQADNNTMFYVNGAKGFRSGAFNGRPTQDDAVGAWEPEIVTGLELGAKFFFPQQGISVNTALFNNRYTDIQVLTFNLVDDVPTIVINNAGKATVRGMEIEASYMNYEGLTLTGGLGYLDAGYDEYELNGVDLSDREFRNAPETTANLNVQYQLGINSLGRLLVNAMTIYQAETFLDAANSEELRTGGYSLLNGGIHLMAHDDSWKLSLHGKNLLDKRMLKTGFNALDSFGFIEASYNPPRRIYLSFTYNLMP